MKDTSPGTNALLFRAMMSREAGDRLAMGMEMTATAKALVWSSIPADWPEEKRRAAFHERFYGSAAS